MIDERLRTTATHEANSCGLSARELQVLRLGREGATDKEIADAMGITVATLRTYWTRVRDKLGAINRTQALVLSASTEAAAPSTNVRERLIGTLSRERVSTWVWRARSRQAYLDGVGAALFGLPAGSPTSGHPTAPASNGFSSKAATCAPSPRSKSARASPATIAT